MRKIIKNGLLNALGTAVYIMLVSSLMFHMESLKLGGNSVLVPITMLILFVFSAALTGMLVFGQPIVWYLNGKKKEAMKLLGWTLGFLLTITIIMFILLISMASL